MTETIIPPSFSIKFHKSKELKAMVLRHCLAVHLSDSTSSRVADRWLAKLPRKEAAWVQRILKHLTKSPHEFKEQKLSAV